MSTIPFVETLKNTIEVMNEIYEGSQFGNATFFKLFWTILKDWVLYVLSFQWFNDLVQFPIILPQSDIDFTQLFTADHSHHLSFLPPLSNSGFEESFLSGVLNCFFLYLPFSCVHFIWLRRFIIEGPWAGYAATLGLILGYLSLLGFCLFGFRPIINAWFGLEPFSYFLGIWLIFTVIFEMAHRPLKILKKSSILRKQLLKICLINFGLVWTDQSGIYQIFGNLSLHSGLTPLDFQFDIWFYFLGLICGSFIWTFLISQAILRFGYLFPRLTNLPYSVWIRGFNKFCLIGCVTLTLTSFPYYGFDYLFANPLGFVPQDQIWEATSIPLLRADIKDANKGRLGEKSSYASIDTDVSLFDRGRYAGGSIVEYHIESLNYQEEYAWRSRVDRLSSRNWTKGGGFLDKFLTTQLGPVEEALQKQKREKKRIQQLTKLKKRVQENKKRLAKSQEPEIFWLSEVDANQYNLENVLSPQNEEEEQGANLYASLIERFIEDYTAEANTEDEQVPDLPNEKMIHFSAFSEISKLGFDVFSMFENMELDPNDEQLAKEIKEKYSDNFVYRFLVHLDISNFLNRQPKHHSLTSKNEISLFEKRLALNEYYDTLRSYSLLPENLHPIFRPLFCGPKSYSNRIYNQQFKGTLKIVERLFSIHLEDEENIPKLSLSEAKKIESAKKFNEVYSLLKKELKEPSVLKFDQPLYKKDFDAINPLMHEQLLESETSTRPFLKEGKPLPFFVGWDTELRKFVVTNRLLTHQKILSNISIPKDRFRRFSATKDIFTKKTSSQKNIKSDGKAMSKHPKTSERKRNFKSDGKAKHPKTSKAQAKLQSTFNFTTWPVTQKALKKNLLFSRFFRKSDDIDMTSVGADLFKYAEPLMEEETVIYKTLPPLLQRLESKSPDKLREIPLAPVRGGFIWPGNEQLKFKFKLPFELPLGLQEYIKLKKWGWSFTGFTP